MTPVNGRIRAHEFNLNFVGWIYVVQAKEDLTPGGMSVGVFAE